MRKALLVLTAMICMGMFFVPTNSAEAYWGYREPRRYKHHHQRYEFRPVFSLTASGGIHFVDNYDTDSRYLYDSYSFAYGLLELGGHLWIHPNLSIDLNLGTHFTTNQAYDNAGWGYVSLKPGIRARYKIFYVRAALDLALGADDARRNGSFLFGFLVGAGVRVEVTRRLRFFAELDYQYLFANKFYMPFYGQLGLEFMF